MKVHDRDRPSALSRPVRLSGRGAFTLLEVLLALALTVVVMAVVGMAIDLHLRSINSSRSSVERDQLARTLMRRVADDLRAAVRQEPFDTSGIEALASGAGKSADSGKGGKSGDDAEEGGLSGPGKAESAQKLTSLGSDDESTSDTGTTTGAPATVAGLYGTAYELQIDVGRVPRPDELAAAGNGEAPMPSDVRTVTYYVATPSTAAAVGAGLIRTELNRATALWIAEQGDYTQLEQFAELVASEVVGVEFRYFDGIEMFTEWDSQVMKGLPVAVEITMAIADPQTLAAEGDAAYYLPSQGTDPDSVYQILVHLPNGQISKGSSGTGSSGSSDSSGVTDLGGSGTNGGAPQ